MAVVSTCSSRASTPPTTILTRAIATSEHLSMVTTAAPKFGGRSGFNAVQMDESLVRKRVALALALARREVGKPLVASALHTNGGSVDRNDAAATGPLMSPSPEFSLEEAVKLQMESLARNDEPRPDHGLEVMYYFANTDGTDSGGSLPQYFGFPSDLYHFGHFALKFKTRYPELINHSGYKVVGAEDVEQADKGGCAHVTVQARRDNGDSSAWIFTMSKHARGQQSPCWLTTSLRRCPSDQDSSVSPQ